MRSEESMERVTDLAEEKCKDTEYWIRDFVGDKKLEDEYLLGDIIGRGASSIVYKCLRKGRTEWACKILKKSQLSKKCVQSDIRTLVKLKHPNLVQLKEVFETHDEIQLIMELAGGGELFERIVERGHYSEEDAAEAVRNILNALQYLHSNGTFHKDLKPENLLYQTEMEDSVLKIADYGIRKLLSDDHISMNKSCTTFSYSAPEILLSKEIDSAVDLWSLGVVTYIMLCGFEPFWDEEGESATNRRVLEGDYSFPSPWWDEVSDSAKELISKLLSVDPKARPTAEEALNHPWTLGISTPRLHMDKTIVRLREFNARRRFRVATTAVIATRRALHLLSPSKKPHKDEDQTLEKCFCKKTTDGSLNNNSSIKQFETQTCRNSSSIDGSTKDCITVLNSISSVPKDGDSLSKTSSKLATELSSQYKENYVGLG